MEMVYARCCGLDVHKRTVVACLLAPGAEGTPTKEVRTFGTMTTDLLALSDWLSAAGCTHVAMESTGVFWKPIYNLLEDRFALVVVNAAAHQGRSWTQDRCARCRVDRGLVAPWLTARQLYPGSAAARAA